MQNDNKLHESLDKLIEKHKDNEYVYGRLVTYIEHLLPIALDNAVEIHKQREDRYNLLTANRNEFTLRFLQTNNYFYSSSTELFLRYDGLHFVIHSENDIHHQILSTISAEKCLRDWKYKINKNIFKRIKERSPLNAIPESVTIQFVINTLCPSIFPTRNHAKYFLTIMGECLSAKNDCMNENKLIYILSPSIKDIIREIGNQCYFYFGIPNIFTSIKYKYYEHNYNDCRLLYIDHTNVYGRKKIPTPPNLEKYMIDFLCVAAHYFVRYGSADKFLTSCSDENLLNNSLFLSKNTPDSIVDMFINKTLIPCASSIVNVKKMNFLWKSFLDEQTIPNIIFYDNLKSILKKKIQYDEEKDCFVGYTSIQLPLVSLFLQFWGENIIELSVANEVANANEELEINEIRTLFASWTTLAKNISPNFILELIQHFYPEVVIEEHKYILNVKCKLWDKRGEISNIINIFKGQMPNINDITVYDIYTFYCTQTKHRNKYGLCVNKRYFENLFAYETSAFKNGE